MAQTTAFRIRSIIFGFEGIFGRGTFPFGAESCAHPGRDLVLFGGTILKNAMQSYKSKLSHFFCKSLLYKDNKIPAYTRIFSLRRHCIGNRLAWGVIAKMACAAGEVKGHHFIVFDAA